MNPDQLPGNPPELGPFRDQQIVSDDGFEQPPYPGVYTHGSVMLPHQQHAMAMAQYYEARMRDHAAAYASAAAGAAWAAAQIAVSAQLPPALPLPIMHPTIYATNYPHPHQHAASYAEYQFHASPYEQFDIPHGSQSPEYAPEERPVKRHHRMPNATGSMDEQERRGRRRQRVDFSSSSDGGRFHLKSQRQRNSNPTQSSTFFRSYKKRREKLNLIGKTGVSALHEWCVHCKKIPPNFVLMPGPTDFFCFAVYVDDLEWSRGRGATKASAKHDAARKALQALVPGVDFDDSGLVMSMSSNEAIEDLPNLAERLAIDATKKRRCDIYPGTSTTTDDDGEDENAYYANRGASVCSALLHAMWQINDDIPEPPSYSYDVPNSSINNGKEGSRPSSFSCTATLGLRVWDSGHGTNNRYAGSSDSDDDLDAKPKAKRKGNVDVTSSEELHTQSDKAKRVFSSTHKMKLLTGVGIGSTKREARHVASAKLLALLFPQCEGMVEVKACAEAARERYAASKALKQQTKRFGGSNASPLLHDINTNTPVGSFSRLSESDVTRLLAKSSDQSMPSSVVELVRVLVGHEMENPRVKTSSRVEDDEVSVESLSLSERKPNSEATSTKRSEGIESKPKFQTRAQSRQEQLERMVDNALQLFNEFDEVGRSLHHAPTYEDVGRTVLRRVDAGDVRYVNKLFLKERKDSMSYLSLIQSITCGSSSSLSWGPTCVALLLCRAIAPYEEPPLGCAILTLGFKFNKGRVMRVTEIESERHLPRERFVECLQQFAASMKCKLDIEPSTIEAGNPKIRMISTPSLHAIVESHLKRKDFLHDKSGSKQLQSVKEEEPDLEDDAKDTGWTEGVESVKDKPSKRSRID